jgi:hypothetical protein
MEITKSKKVYISSPTAKRQRKVDGRTKVVIKPQQRLFIEAYTNPKSKTFNNARQSALQAGFSENYADQILYKPQKWLMEIEGQLNDEKMLLKAEENFREVQGLQVASYDPKLDKVVVQTDVLAHRNKVDMFLAERLNKAKYSTRTENATIVKVEHTIDEETRKRLDALL